MGSAKTPNTSRLYSELADLRAPDVTDEVVRANREAELRRQGFGRTRRSTFGGPFAQKPTTSILGG